MITFENQKEFDEAVMEVLKRRLRVDVYVDESDTSESNYRGIRVELKLIDRPPEFHIDDTCFASDGCSTSFRID